MRSQGYIHTRYKLFSRYGWHFLNELICRGHGNSCQLRVYLILHVGHTKYRMTWNHFSGCFYLVVKCRNTTGVNQSESMRLVFDYHTDMDRHGNVRGGGWKLACVRDVLLGPLTV